MLSSLISYPLRIHIGDHRRREYAEGSLANADDCVPKIELPVAVHGRGQQCRDTPQQRSSHDQRLARHPVAEPSGKRRREHVGDEERSR